MIVKFVSDKTDEELIRLSIEENSVVKTGSRPMKELYMLGDKNTGFVVHSDGIDYFVIKGQREGKKWEIHIEIKSAR